MHRVKSFSICNVHYIIIQCIPSTVPLKPYNLNSDLIYISHRRNFKLKENIEEKKTNKNEAPAAVTRLRREKNAVVVVVIQIILNDKRYRYATK